MDIAQLGLSIRSDGVVVASDRLKKFGQDAARAEQAANSLGNAFRRFAPIIGAITAALSVRALKAYADSWSDMQSRVGAAVKNMEAAPALMERLVDVANASYSPLGQTVEIYGRNVSVLRDLGYGARDAADFTESLNHMLVLTATRGERAASVQNALSKAMAVGKLQADGLETVLANGGEVAEALAKELGTNVNGLRAMASQGKITGDVIAKSIVKPLEDVRERAGEMPATMEDAMVRLDTNFGALVGRIDQALGISENFAGTLINVADTMRAWTNNIVQAAIVVQTGFNAAIETASSVLSALGGSFDSTSALIIAGAGAAAFAVTALTTAITMGLIKAVAALGLALMANPFALFIGAIAATVTAAYLFRDEIKDIVGVDVFKVFYDSANTIINLMVGAYKAVVAVWEHLPGQFGRIGKLAVNALLDALGSIELSWTNPFSGTKYELFNFDLSDMKFKLDEAESYVEGVAAAAFRAEQGIDRLKGASDGISTMWSDAGDAMTKFGEIANTAGGKAVAAFDPKAAKEAEKLAKAYDKIVTGARQFISEKEMESRALFMTEEAAARLRHEQDLLNKAANDNIKLTPKQREQLMGLAGDMAAAEVGFNRLREALDFGKDLVKGFVSDLRSGLEQGKGFWRSFGDAAMNVLDKIVDKLLNNVIDALFQVNSVGSGGGGGGFLSGILGGIGRIFGFASGGYTGPGAASQPAGIVHAGEYVMSKSAVDRLGVGYLDALHNAAKGYQMGGYARAHVPANVNMRGYRSGGYVHRPAAGQEVLKIELVSRFDADGGFESAVERTSRPVAMQESAKAAGKLAGKVPAMVDQRVNTRQTRGTRA